MVWQVIINEKIGFINTKGEVVIKPAYEETAGFLMAFVL
jgi:hypothetical protein